MKNPVKLINRAMHKRFVNESVEFAEAVHNGDFTGDWDAWILSIIEEEFSKSA